MPTTQAEVRSFISVVDYYCRFVDCFAGVEARTEAQTRSCLVQATLRQRKTYCIRSLGKGMPCSCQQPLTDLLREGQFEYPFPPAAQATFLELRSRLSRAPLLKYFDPRDETELWTDASDTAIGGAVLQRDARGNLRPVAYYSRRLSPSEEKYSTYQLELLAIRDCHKLLAFRFYLVGLPFVCKTDHCSLQWLTEQAEMSPLQ